MQLPDRKEQALQKLVELGSNARKLAGNLDGLLYNNSNVGKKEEKELANKLNRKLHINSMPNPDEFKSKLVAFQRDLDKSQALKAYSKEAMLAGPT